MFCLSVDIRLKILSEYLDPIDRSLWFLALRLRKTSLERFLENNIGIYAIKKGYLNLLEWASDNKYLCHDRYSLIHCVVRDILLEEGIPDKFQIGCANYCCIASEYGHLDVLRWLIENNYPWTLDMSTIASTKGHLHILQWLKDNNFPLSDEAFESAIPGNHLDVLKWIALNKNPLKWNLKSSCAKAAQYGNLEILQWLRKTKAPNEIKKPKWVSSVEHYGVSVGLCPPCPWSWDVYMHAAFGGHLHILCWAKDNGCPIQSEVLRRETVLENLYSIARGLNFSHIIEWLDNEFG